MKRTLARCLTSPGSVWLLWLGILGWNWWELWRSEMHPAWWPIISLVVLLLVCVFIQAVRLVLAFARRRHRLPALRSFAWAMIPPCLMVAHISYVYSIALSSLVKIDPFTMTYMPTAVVAAEIEAHLRYPLKTTGERVVMFHHGAENAAQQVAAADRYLAELDEVMGVPSTETIYWIRGSILGRGNISLCALAMGSSWENDEITKLDKHELAHAAISQHLTASLRIPMVLAEGWAEFCAAEDDTAALWTGAAREAKWSPSLAELTGPEWAWLDAGPVYTQGGPFVDMLVEQYGGEKFLELYHTCSPNTFDEDCRRVFGAGLAEIERQYRSRLAEWSAGRRIRDLLELLPLAEGVDREDWQRFVTQYCETVDRSDILPEYAVELDRTYFIQPNEEYPDGLENRDTAKVISTDHLKAVVDERSVIVITRGDSFRLYRDDASEPWKLSHNFAQFPAMYRWVSHDNFHLNDPGAFRPEFGWHRTYRWKQHPPTLTTFERTEDGQGERCRFVMEYAPEDGSDEPFTFDVTFDKNSNWRVMKSVETRSLEEGQVHESEYRYTFEQEGYLAEVRAEGGASKLDGTPDYEMQAQWRYSPTAEVDPADYTLAAFGIEDDTRESLPAIPTPVLVFLILAGVQFLAGVCLWRAGREDVMKESP